ncbi:Nn.00g012360.m01.CDS01 [Neocucurbitaria sp. VM-36]
MDPPPDPSLIPAFPSAAAQSNARSFAGVALALHGVAIMAFGARMWSRCFPVFRMHLDDYVCAVAYILVVVNSILLLAAVPYSFGHSPTAFFLSDAQEAFKHAAIAQPIWAWAMAAIKTSFALMLLRIEQSIKLRRFLWAMIAIQVILGVYNTLTIFLQCVPFYKAWDLVGSVPGTCWARRVQSISTICVSVLNILTDFALALMPISFLRKIQRPVRERIIVGALMGLGVFAGIASILKIVAAAQFGRTGDPINESVMIGMWSVVEELVGIIVICIPCLRSPFQRALEYCGVLSVRIRQHTHSRGYGRTYDRTEAAKKSNGSQSRSQSQSHLAAVGDSDPDAGFKLDNLRTEGSEENILCEPRTRRGEIWCTKEVMVENDRISRMPSYERPIGGPDASWTDEPFNLNRRDLERP